MKLVLKREPQQPSASCTLGLLFVGSLSLVTIERPWLAALDSKGGIQGRSCVPTGLYKLVRHNSDAHPMTWAMVNHDLDVVHYPQDGPPMVRSACLIHPANWAFELRGCIAPGTRTGVDAQGYRTYDSIKAMRMIQAAVLWDDSHTLEIS